MTTNEPQGKKKPFNMPQPPQQQQAAGAPAKDGTTKPAESKQWADNPPYDPLGR